MQSSSAVRVANPSNEDANRLIQIEVTETRTHSHSSLRTEPPHASARKPSHSLKVRTDAVIVPSLREKEYDSWLKRLHL